MDEERVQERWEDERNDMQIGNDKRYKRCEDENDTKEKSQHVRETGLK